MTVAIFQEWFRKFCDLVTQRPLLLIMDGHVTHLDKGTIEFAIQQNITLLKLPAHTTDVLQPLDKCCFGPLKLAWNNALIEWQRLNQRKLTKSEFSNLICQIWHNGLTDQVIKSSFEKTGVYPCNKERYPMHRLNPQKLKKYEERDPTEDVLYPFEDKENQVTVEEPVIPDLADDSSTTLLLESTDSSASKEGKDNPSFESLLLSKIRRTTPTSKQRRKIDANAKVLTSEEYLEEIKETEKKNRKKQKSSRKRKHSSPSSSEDEGANNCTVTYQDESDLENITLEDIIAEEDVTSDFGDCQIDAQEELRKDDYILVKIASKTNVVYFVAQIDEVKEDEVDVRYLKRQGNKFVFPESVEKCAVLKSDVQEKLPAPNLQGGTSRTANQFIFSIDFIKYNVK